MFSSFKKKIKLTKHLDFRKYNTISLLSENFIKIYGKDRLFYLGLNVIIKKFIF